MPIRLDWIAAWRSLRRKPIYALTVALALGIGIGAATIVFSWFEGLFLRPIPAVRESYALQIFQLRRSNFRTTAFSYPDYRDISEALASSMTVAAYSMDKVTLAGAGKPHQYWALFVSGNFFSALELRPAAGRLLDSSDTVAEPAAVLSYEWWQTRFEADPGIVGRTVYLNQRPIRIVGVAPREFQGPYTGLSLGLYLPVALQDWVSGGPPRLADRRASMVTLIARLKQGTSREQAVEAARTVVRRLDQTYPKGAFDAAEVSLIPLWKSPVGAQAIMGPVMLALAGVVFAVLLLASSNAAGVMLIENAGRRRDLSIRVALGASRGGLVAYCLAEAALLSVLAAAVGLAITHLAANRLQDLVPDIQFPVKLNFPVNGPVLGFALAASAVTAAFCGLWCALEARWQSVAVVLRSETSNASSSRQRSRLRGAFIAAQVALSFLLLCLSALFYRSADRARTVDLGFDPRSVSLVRVDLSGSHYSSDRASAFFQSALTRVRSNSAIESAAFATSVPLGFGDSQRVTIVPDGGSEERRVWSNRVSPDYFATLGIRLLSGRVFTELDRSGSSPVAVVNEALARELWNSSSAVGRNFVIGNRRHEIVGVVRNSKIWSLTDEAQPYLYLSLWQSEAQTAALHVRSKESPAVVFRIVDRELEHLDPSLPSISPATLAQQVEASLFPQHIALVMLGIFSLLGIYLMAIGLYGLIAHAARSRRKEIAIRIAMGATAAEVCRLVGRQAAWLVAAGLCAGAILTAVCSRIVVSILAGSGVLDPWSMAAAGVLIAVIATLATWLPTMRAARTETADALRAE